MRGPVAHEACAGLRLERRRIRPSPASAAAASPVDGLDGLQDGLGGPVNGLPIFFRLSETGIATASVNTTINRDDSSEAVAKTASVNGFCLPR